MQSNFISTESEMPPLTSVATFARQIGRTRCTLWRWQKLGWLDASVNIAGKPYLTRDAIDRFVKRAAAGDFAKVPVVPRRNSGEAVAA